MNELVDALSGSFQVSTYPNNPAAPHPRFASYKQKPAGLADQYVRRQKILERQKEKRLDFMNLARRLTDDDWKGLKEDDEEEDDQMDVEVLIRKPGRHYKNQLMLSEWMIDRPADLEENWLMTPCPVGKRSLVVASKGYTSVYAKNGYRVNQFPSLLPGGNKGSRQMHTILDCIFVEAEKTFYTLDLMSWGNHPIYESETEFRFFWANCKFSETPGLSEIGPQNKYKFVQLPSCVCTKENITRVMATPMNTELDGLLFYHRAAHYLFGPTPLVLWLKPYMLPEILGVSVPQSFLDQKPHEYVCFAHHVDRVTSARARLETQRHLAKRGQPSLRRRGWGRVPSRGARDAVGDPMDVAVLTSVCDVTASPFTGRGGRSGKGRGRGRGLSRGQGRSQGLGQGRGQYQCQGEEMGMEEEFYDTDMDVTSSRAGRGRRRNRKNKNGTEGMDTVDNAQSPELSYCTQTEVVDTSWGPVD